MLSANIARETTMGTLQEVTLELMLLGSTPGVGSSQALSKQGFLHGSAPGKTSGDKEGLVLCHVARATKLPALQR